SPDGNLWLVPWEALTLPGGRFAIEGHRISYVTSGRDLLPGPRASGKPTAPLVLADPDFDLDPGRAVADPSPEGAGTRSLSAALRLGKVPRLPGTAAEAKAIAPGLRAYAGAEPRVRTRERALESAFKSATRPRVLALCTHGFFLPDQAAEAGGW